VPRGAARFWWWGKTMEWALSLLFVYEGIFWLIFYSLVFLATYRFGWIAFLLSLFVMPWIVGFLDVQWIQREMSKPDWDGSPDMDFVFSFGVIVHIIMIGFVQLLIGGLALFLRSRQLKATPTTSR
jgi:hypothetical protein